LSLPKFGDQIDQLSEFENLLDSLLNQNQNLHVIEKFQYLRLCLVSNAAAIVCNYPLSNDPYYLACNALQDSYNK